MLSYVLVVVLSNISLSHSRPSRYLPGMVLAAGIISALMSNTGSVRSFLMIRIPLAAFEAAFYPGASYVLSCWYKPRELGKRIAIFPTISIITQLVGMGITRYGPERLPISSVVSIWRTVFLADGIVTIGVALLAYVLMPDYPATTRSFSRRERELATIRLIRRGQDTGSSTSRGVERLRRTDSVVASIADPRVHLVLFVTFFAMAAGTLGHLLCTTTVQTGYNALRGHYMAVPVYIVSALVLNLLAWSSDIMRERRWHMVLAIAMAIVGVTVAKSNISGGAKLIFATLFAAGIWSALHQAFMYAATSIRAPAEKRAVVLALVHAVGGTATIVSGSMHPRMMGTRSGVNMIMSWTFLGLAILAIAVIPSLYRMDNYRGTRAERALESRRHGCCSEIREKEVLLAEDDDVLDY
jgi:MFS family permease